MLEVILAKAGSACMILAINGMKIRMIALI